MTRPPLLTRSQQETLLTAAAATAGFAVGVSAYPKWIRPAPPGQLPGFMTAHNLDAHAPMGVLLTVIALTIAAAWGMRPLLRFFFAPDARPWARRATAASFVVALWHVTIARNFAWTAIPPLLVTAVALALRRADLRFSRRDFILLPAFGAVYIALSDLTVLSTERNAILAAGLVFATRVAIVFVRGARGLSASLCFSLAPLALLSEAQFLGRRERYDGWPALVIAIVTPFVLRLFVSDTAVTRRRLRAAIALVIYPLAVYAYASATSLTTAEGKPRVDFFEDAHHLTPAGEMLRGELPFRDVIPQHGLIHDGLLDYAVFSRGPVTIGKSLRAREWIGRWIGVAIYAITAAATGSPDAGILAFFFAAFVGIASGSPRFLPPLIALAFLAGAARTRNRWLLAAGAAFAIVAGLMSAEFGPFTLIAVAVTAWRLDDSRSARLRSFGWATAGALVVVIPATIAMSIARWFDDFLRVTIFEVMSVGPAFALQPFEAPESLKLQFPQILTAVFDRGAALYLLWVVSLATIAVVVARGVTSRGRRRRMVEPLITIVTFVVVVGVSYAERHHTYYSFVAAPLLVATCWWLLRARSSSGRFAGIALAGLLLVLANMTAHLSVTAALRNVHGPLEGEWREVGLPRARGALFFERDIGVLDAVKRYAETRLGPQDTFFDFTNRPMLYFLLDRDMPVRQVEIGFYESEERQREVIERIARNPHVRAAVVPLPENGTVGSIGFVINARRTPLVWKYLADNFEPDFQEGEVAIWRRK